MHPVAFCRSPTMLFGVPSVLQAVLTRKKACMRAFLFLLAQGRSPRTQTSLCDNAGIIVVLCGAGTSQFAKGF